MSSCLTKVKRWSNKKSFSTIIGINSAKYHNTLLSGLLGTTDFKFTCEYEVNQTTGVSTLAQKRIETQQENQTFTTSMDIAGDTWQRVKDFTDYTTFRFAMWNDEKIDLVITKCYICSDSNCEKKDDSYFKESMFDEKTGCTPHLAVKIYSATSARWWKGIETRPFFI